MKRRGTIIVLMACMLVLLFAFMALCIDIGWTTLTKSQLQNAADAAAAAGAAQLADNYAAYSLPSQPHRSELIAGTCQSANRYTGLYGSYNGAGGVNALNLLSQDIQVGFTDANGSFQPNYGGYPNTVCVVARRDSEANSPVDLFFAPVLGANSLKLTASASATIYTGLISSFDAASKRARLPARLLPSP